MLSVTIYTDCSAQSCSARHEKRQLFSTRNSPGRRSSGGRCMVCPLASKTNVRFLSRFSFDRTVIACVVSRHHRFRQYHWIHKMGTQAKYRRRSCACDRWLHISLTHSTCFMQLVKQYRAAGAIIIAKTNVPQTMLTFECNNPLWGRTLNPYSDKHTCGGSSGGEAALLAMSGAAIGVGSDTGGSLRIPIHYCGLYSLKPAANRVSSTGARGKNTSITALSFGLR